jgi:hypothetical protein
MTNQTRQFRNARHQPQQHLSAPAAPKAREEGSAVTATTAVGGAATCELLFTGLPTNLRQIYQTTLQRIAPPGVKVPEPVLLNDGSSDTVMLQLQVGSAQEAKALAKRLHHTTVFGAYLDAAAVPLSSLRLNRRACCVEVLVTPAPNVAALGPDVEDLEADGAGDAYEGAAAPAGRTAFGYDAIDTVTSFLQPAPGLLSVTPAPLPEDAAEGAAAVWRFNAFFADEGCALHARAVLSGRAHQGYHYFLRRVVDARPPQQRAKPQPPAAAPPAKAAGVKRTRDQ